MRTPVERLNAMYATSLDFPEHDEEHQIVPDAFFEELCEIAADIIVSPPPSRPAGEDADIAGGAFLERLGKRVRAEWVRYCQETGDTKLSHLAGWDYISEWDKEVDRRIGRGVVDEWETILEEGERPEIRQAREDDIRAHERERA